MTCKILCLQVATKNCNPCRAKDKVNAANDKVNAMEICSTLTIDNFNLHSISTLLEQNSKFRMD